MDELFARDYSLIYTTDPNMASYKGEDKMPVQVRVAVLHLVSFGYCCELSLPADSL